jgi:DNA mismatch repair protein MutL
MVMQSLGKFNLSPSIDFSLDANLIPPPLRKGEDVSMPSIKVDPDYNPFRKPDNQGDYRFQRNTANWERLYAEIPVEQRQTGHPGVPAEAEAEDERVDDDAKPAGLADIIQLHQRYIVTSIKSGLLVIDQHMAHQRILYERYMESLANGSGASQRELFPRTLELSPSDSLVVQAYLPGLHALGFDIREFGRNTFVIEGIPAGMGEEDPVGIIERFIEACKESTPDPNAGNKARLARAMARTTAIRPGVPMRENEMHALIDELFACQVPDYAPDGRACIIIIKTEELEKRFR